MKVLFVFGTRPEAIKMSPLINRLKNNPDFDAKVCVTGQHREMLDQVLSLFNIDSDFDLNVMRSNQDLTDLTSQVLRGVRDVLSRWRPDAVLVHGDTSTTFAASLAAFHQKIAVGHVEAGLRTGNLYSPWPEEANRKLTTSLARWHFAPTENARRNLLTEGVDPTCVHVTGNTVIDALFMARKKINGDAAIRSQLDRQFSFLDSRKKTVLVTGHRRENQGAGLQNICDALLKLSSANSNIEVVYPVHPNPHVRGPVTEALAGRRRIHLIEPLEYLPFIYLIERSYIVLTDSGGIQEEAPSLGKPVLVMRDTTERPEAVAAGTVKLVGTSIGDIIRETSILLSDSEAYAAMAHAHNPYGDGTASTQISQILINKTGQRQNDVNTGDCTKSRSEDKFALQ